MKLLIISIIFLFIVTSGEGASVGTTPKCCPIGEVLVYDPDSIYKCTKNTKFTWNTKNLRGFQKFCYNTKFRILIEKDSIQTYDNGTLVINNQHYDRDMFCLESLENELVLITCMRPAILNKCNAANEILAGFDRMVPQNPDVIQQIWSVFENKGIEITEKTLHCKNYCQNLDERYFNDVYVSTEGDVVLTSIVLHGQYCLDYKVTGDYEGFYRCLCDHND